MSKMIKLKDATDAQLREFATAHLGMSFGADDKTGTIRAAISAAWGKDEIPVAEEGPETAKPSAKKAQRTAGAAPEGKPKKVRLIVNATDDDGGDEAIQLGVNGKLMLVPRGEEVEIPYPYYEVLQNAITHRYEQLRDGGINPVPRKVPLYPYQVLGYIH